MMTNSTQILPQVKLSFKKMKWSTIGNTANPKDIWKRNFRRQEQDVSEGTDVRDEKHSQVLYLNFQTNSLMKGNTFLLFATKEQDKPGC